MVAEPVKLLSDEELYAKLKEHNLPHGPILPSTRSVYEGMLVQAMSGKKTGNSSSSSTEFTSPASPVQKSTKNPSPERKPKAPVTRHSFTRYLTGDAEQNVTSYESYTTYDGPYNNDSEEDLTLDLNGSNRIGSTASNISSRSQYSSLSTQPLYDSLYKQSQQRKGVHTPSSKCFNEGGKRSSSTGLVGLIGLVLLIIAIFLGYLWLWHSPDPYIQLEMEAKKLVGKMANKEDGVSG